MPRVSKIIDMFVYIYFFDHGVPHFHVPAPEGEASVSIASGQVIAGRLAARRQKVIKEWFFEHRFELEACWLRAQSGELPGTINGREQP